MVAASWVSLSRPVAWIWPVVHHGRCVKLLQPTRVERNQKRDRVVAEDIMRKMAASSLSELVRLAARLDLSIPPGRRGKRT